MSSYSGTFKNTKLRHYNYDLYMFNYSAIFCKFYKMKIESMNNKLLNI